MVDRILNYIKDNFSKKTAFFCGLVGLLIFFATIDSFIEKFVSDTSYRGVAYMALCVAWFIFWLYERTHLPKNRRGYIGVVICVESENDKQKKRLKNDFIRRIRELIIQKNLKNIVNVILLTNYQAEFAIKILEEYARNKQNKKADQEWQKIRKRTQCHFFIYGGIKERQDEDNRYYLDLEALVIHAPVQFPVQKQIVQDFLSVWYKQISFQEKIEFKGFQFAADAIFIAVQYVVGIAALVSGNVALAFELHSGLNNDPYFLRFNPLPPNLLNVKKKLKSLLAEENFLIAKDYSKQGLFVEATKHTDQSLAIESNYGAYLLKSFVEFLHKNNPSEALKCVYHARELAKDDGTWRYNEGFLLMYMERFEEALRVYERISSTSFVNEQNILIEIYAFNDDLLKREHSKVQSYFIIGFLKYKKELNYPGGWEYLEKFLLNSESESKYRILRERAQTYREELKKLMDL